MNMEFWDYLQNLVDNNKIVIDRPKGSTHHRYPGEKYPVDYGYLEGTISIDMGGVDIWIGTKGKREVVGILCTVDLQKKDAELKILFDCTDDEIKQVCEFSNSGQMRAINLKKNP